MVGIGRKVKGETVSQGLLIEALIGNKRPGQPVVHSVFSIMSSVTSNCDTAGRNPGFRQSSAKNEAQMEALKNSVSSQRNGSDTIRPVALNQ
jgi:hypothetical protein